MSSKDYWAKREREALQYYIADEAEYDKQINKIYTNMLANCQKEINAFYGRYADKEGITIAEAKKRVSSMDIKAYEAKAKRYVKDKTFSKEANEEMRLYNATMRINRLEMLKANIGLELIAGADDLEKFMEGVLKGRTEAELARQAGILGKTIKNNAEAVHSIVNASFHNATFSDRIWNNSAAMKADLDKLIQSGLIAGKNANVLAKDLQKYFIGEPRLKNGKKGAKYRAEVLMRTELARVQTEAQKQSFIRNGFTQYQFIVNGNCCDICAGIAGKVFDVEKMMPGENAPPLHPLCRCSTAAYSDRKEYEEWLDYLENGGTTEEYNKIKTLDSETKINAEKEKWLKEHYYDMYGDSLEEMEKGFWEEAADGSMPGESAFMTLLNNKLDATKQKLGYKNIVNVGKKSYSKIIKGKHTIADDLKAVNPNFSKNSYKWANNCQRCVPTYEMRRRGFDVTAKPKKRGKDETASAWRDIFDNAQWQKVGANTKDATIKTIVDNMTQYGAGSRAEIYVIWRGGRSSHVFVAENDNGVVRFIDPQTNDADVTSYFAQCMTTRTEMCRIDNLKTTEHIRGCCE